MMQVKLLSLKNAQMLKKIETDVSDCIKNTNICIMEIPEREQRRAEKIFEEILLKTVQIW